jgi:hypothetical protein
LGHFGYQNAVAFSVYHSFSQNARKDAENESKNAGIFFKKFQKTFEIIVNI